MAQYTDAVFRVNNLDEAKRIILTPERGLDTDTRWQAETPYLADQLHAWFAQGAPLVLDFGCGVGRLSKAWLEKRQESRVIGVDISTGMRQLAPGYVESDHFSAVSPTLFDALLANGVRFDGIIASWIIQHCQSAEQEITRLQHALRPGGRLMVVNTVRRAVPTEQGWTDDGFDVRADLQGRFATLSLGQLPESATSQFIAENTFIGIFEKRR